MTVCLGCEEPSDRVWLMLAAGPELGLCDGCSADLGEIAASAEPDAPPSPSWAGPCRLCGAEAPDARLIVCSKTGAAVCHDCATFARSVIAERIDVDDPWYRPLRFDAGGRVGAPGAGPVDVTIDDARVAALVASRLADLDARGLPTDEGARDAVERRAIAEALGEALAAAGRVAGYDAALAWVRELRRDVSAPA